ncbi:MAG: hypothetical protein WA840_14215, partial [Caulobacteraceae bacterium]
MSTPVAAGSPPGPGGDPGAGSNPQRVAFDFDGTLTVKDSFNAFLTWRTPPARLALALLRLAPRLAAYAFDRDRGRVKA